MPLSKFLRLCWVCMSRVVPCGHCGGLESALRFFNCTGSLQGTDVATEDGGPILSNSCSTPWVCHLCLVVVSNPWFLLFGFWFLVSGLWFLVACFWPFGSGGPTLKQFMLKPLCVCVPALCVLWLLELVF